MKTINVYTNTANLDGPLEHDYDIISNEEGVTELYRSGNTTWTHPREKVVTCIEDEMKGEYKININGKKIKLNYAEAYELFILFGILNPKHKVEYRESTIIKSI